MCDVSFSHGTDTPRCNGGFVISIMWKKHSTDCDADWELKSEVNEEHGLGLQQFINLPSVKHPFSASSQLISLFFSSLQMPHIVWVHVHVSENLVNVKKKDQKKKSPAFLFSPLCWIPKSTKKNKEFRRKGLLFYAAMSVITFTTAAPFS